MNCKTAALFITELPESSLYKQLSQEMKTQS